MGRSKTARLDLATTPELRARMEAEAERRGQSLTVFVTRALEAALGGQVSEDPCDPASTTATGHGAGSIPAHRPKAGGSSAGRAPVKAAASPRTPRRTGVAPAHSARCTCMVCKPPKKGKR